MEALIYVSVAEGLPRPASVAAIVATAHRVNPTLSLTGMLLWHDTRFAQLLEGPTASVDAMMDRLLTDPRHRDVTVLTRWPQERRLFPDWSMSCSRLDSRQPWGLLDQLDIAQPQETAAWLLYLMDDVHRRAGRRKVGRGASS